MLVVGLAKSWKEWNSAEQGDIVVEQSNLRNALEPHSNAQTPRT